MISNVSVAVDGSSHAQRAAAIAAKFGARAHLIYVMPRHEVPADIKDLASMEHVEAGSVEMDGLHAKLVAPVMAAFREAGVADVSARNERIG